MTFEEILDHAIAMLQRRGRMTYRTLQRQFALDDDTLTDLKDELLYAHPEIRDDAGRGLVWTGAPSFAPPATSPPASTQERTPLSYTPKHLAEKILTSRAALEGERKQVTVLFADIKGSMALLEDLDPEDARRIIDPALQIMMDAVHRYEGYVAQTMGDGILALFGAPIAHEDHPQRALYAALRMQEESKRYAETLLLEHGVNVQIRVGINTGDVVVRAIRKDDLHADYVPIGHSTGLAARMESLATPGSILVTEHTYKLTAGYFDFHALGTARVKGVSVPVPLYEVMGASPLQTRFQVAARRGLVPFVGRRSEMEQIQRALELVTRGQGQIVAVVGEPGVGKSRLFYECKLGVPRDWLILETFSVSHGKAYPYLPLIDLLKHYFAITPHDDERQRREKVGGKVLMLDRRLEDTLPYLLALLGVTEPTPAFLRMDAQMRRRRTFETVKRLLVRESLNQPLLLICEDLQWLDTETQALLDVLSESVATARFLLLVNYRPEYHHGWGSKTYYTQLRLDPLRREEAEELLTALLGAGMDVQPLKRRILEQTEGNPFFMEEVVQTLVEEGVLAGERGQYHLEHAPTALHIPPTVQGVLAARIDRLAAEEKALLQTLAVIGSTFPLRLLTQVVEQPEDVLYQGLSHLQAAEFLYEQPAFPDPEYTFKHALTQEVAYTSLLLERRKVLHERTAQALESLYGDRLEEHYGELAHHYSRSGNTEKAVVYLHRAGHQAVEQSAYAEAVSHLTTALDLLATLPESRTRSQQELVVQMTLGPALRATKGGGAPEMERLYIRARELCERVGEPRQLFRVLWGLRVVYTQRGEYQTIRGLEEQLLSLAQRLQAPDLLLEAHHARWSSLFYGGELAAAQPHLEQGVRLYEPQRHHTHAALYSGHDPGSCCRMIAALSLWLLGYPDQAVASSEAALALAQQLAHPLSLTSALYWAGVLHHLRREAPLTQARAEAAMIIATDREFPQYFAQATLLRGWALAGRGQGEEGITQIHQGLAASRATGATRDRPYYMALLAEASAQVGQSAEGLEALAEALATLAKSTVRWWEAELYRLKGELLLQQSVAPPGEAEACFHQALAVARRQQAKSLELRAAMSLSRLWQCQGTRAEARPLLAEIYDWFTEGFDTADLQEAKALLDALQ